MSLIIILLVGLFVVWIICRGNLYFHIYYLKNAGQDCFNLAIYLFDYVKIYQYKKQHAITTLINNKIDKITGEKKSKSVNKPKKRKDFLVQFKKYSVKQILSLPWVCRKMHLKIKIASEDAAETAIFYGVVHTIKSVLYQELLKRIKFKERPEFLIIPDFDGKEKEFLFKCIISIKIGNVIHILKNSI